jgi:heme-degrading monooxygenase HmoA
MSILSASESGAGGDFQTVRLNRFVHMDPAKLARAVGPVRDELAPGLARLPGCRTVLVGVDLDAGTGTVATLWESAADMRAGSRGETVAREQAVSLAGASMGAGLVDSYGVEVEVSDAGAEAPQWARLSRWEGIRSLQMRLALEEFAAERLDPLTAMPGFGGILVATNALLGNALTISLWSSREALEASLGWERESRARVESDGFVPRKVIADTYRLAVAPALRDYRARPSLSRRESRLEAVVQ